MNNYIEFENYGVPHKCQLKLANYTNGNLAIRLEEWDDYIGWVPYACLTTNIDKLPLGYVALDINNFPAAADVVNENHLGTYADRYIHSGYCKYPVYRMDLTAVNEYVPYCAPATQWDVEETLGYKPHTTFWDSFVLAESEGIGALTKAHKDALRTCATFDYIKLTELVMVLKQRLLANTEKDFAITKKYKALLDQTDELACDKLNGTAFMYYLRNIKLAEKVPAE